MLRMFSQSVVASAIICAVVCVRAVDANRINKLIGKAGSVLGLEFDSLAVVSERWMTRTHSTVCWLCTGASSAFHE